MKIVPLEYTITRSTSPEHKDAHGKYKKLYDGVLTPNSKRLSDAYTSRLPSLSLDDAADAIASMPSFAFIPEDTIVVVDTDDQTTYADMSLLMATEGVKATFTVMSDVGFGHFYFTPTDYYRKSPVFHTSRKDLGGIDLMQGKSFVWGFGEGNHTKLAPEGLSLLDATPIPDAVVDYLVGLVAERETTRKYSDVALNVTYVGKPLENALLKVDLMLDSKSKEYSSTELWEPFKYIAPYLIPNKYKAQMDKSTHYHPDTLPHSVSASAFIQSSVAKMLRDASISHSNGMRYLNLVTTRLWSAPITLAQLRGYTQNYTTQEFNGVRYHYDPAIMYGIADEFLLVSLNDGPYGRVYLEAGTDHFLVEAPEELVDMGKWASFRVGMTTLSNSYLVPVDRNPSNYARDLARNDLTNISHKMLRVSTVKDITKPYGIDRAHAVPLYNTIKRTIYHNIILGVEPEPKATIEDFADIRDLFYNLTADHSEDEQAKLFRQFLYLLKCKGESALYCALLFQLNGKEGVGKGVFVDLLAKLFGGKYTLDVEKPNKHHNAESENMMIAQQSEIAVTARNWEALKNKTGNTTKMIEPKGVDAYNVRNTETVFVETNGTAVFTDERRIVLFQSFTGVPWNYDRRAPRMALQLRRMCAYLRDLDHKDYNPQILSHASYWNGARYKASMELEQASMGNDAYLVVLDIYKHYKSMSGKDIAFKLEDALGEDYWYELKEGNKELWLILTTKGQQKDKRDASYALATNILVQKGLAQDKLGELPKDIGRNTNHNRGQSNVSPWSKVPYFLRFNLTSEQFAEFTGPGVPALNILDETPHERTLVPAIT